MTDAFHSLMGSRRGEATAAVVVHKPELDAEASDVVERMRSFAGAIVQRGTRRRAVKAAAAANQLRVVFGCMSRQAGAAPAFLLLDEQSPGEETGLVLAYPTDSADPAYADRIERAVLFLLDTEVTRA